LQFIVNNLNIRNMFNFWTVYNAWIVHFDLIEIYGGLFPLCFNKQYDSRLGSLTSRSLNHENICGNVLYNNWIWCKYCILISWSVWGNIGYTWYPGLVLWRHQHINLPTTNANIKLKSDNGKNLFLMQSLPFVTNLH
jgi:hypothetical protein